MKLKIFEQNQHLKDLTPFELMAKDITILNGIVKGEPTYEKGRKAVAGYYLDKEQTNLAIQKIFSDELDENGFLKGLNILIKWFDIYGNPVLVKRVYVPLSVSESAEIIIKRRKRMIDYLKESGVRLGVKEYIDSLFNYYSNYQQSGITRNLLNSFIENGTEELKDAVLNENNEEIVGILNHILPTGTTIKESLLDQIS
ncbi:hypothetical protein [Chryseobacterium mucoviscidosis]|uniref:hypothetical protein n=1 Tax=Chryseobacterium mucoviscidosis TaxID=1945581 RepID=UPI00301AF73F